MRAPLKRYYVKSILPFLLFSATAGQLADKYDKTLLIRFVKTLEIGIMLLAAWGACNGR